MNNLQELIDIWINEHQDFINLHGTDCSELAEAISNYLKRNKYKAEILQISTDKYDEHNSNNICDLAICEDGKIERFSYHHVTLVNSNIVIDIHNLPFMKLDDYKKQLEELNTNNKLIYKILD